jgi:uncharacterized protein
VTTEARVALIGYGLAGACWGDTQAQSNLGAMYATGQGVRQDYAEAMKWYRRAADQGDTRSQYNLGVMYDAGRGVPEDYAEATKWYRKAAEQGQADAQNNLGVMYELGQGVPQDYVQAHQWYNLAAARYPASSTEESQKAVKNRDRVAAKMTPSQISEAQRIASEWRPK